MEAPKGGIRVHTLECFHEKVQPCTHLAVYRPTFNYFHHFFVELVNNEDITVIQSGIQGTDICVHRKVIKYSDRNLLDFESGVYLIKKDNYPETEEEKRKASTRAKNRLGEECYQATMNNCEHFVNFVMTGEPNSEQMTNPSFKTQMFASVVDCLCEIKVGLIKMLGRASTIKLSQIYNYKDFYEELIKKKCFKWLWSADAFKELTEEFSDIIANVASSGMKTGARLLSFVPTFAEICFLVRDIYKYTQMALNLLITWRDWGLQMVKRLCSASVAIVLDLMKIPAYVMSLVPFVNPILMFALGVLSSQLIVTFAVPFGVDMILKLF